MHIWALDHVQVVDLDGDTIRFAPPEYVIIRKLQFFSEGGSHKHLRDINRMLESLGQDWPRDTLQDLVKKHGLEAEWHKAQAASS